MKTSDFVKIEKQLLDILPGYTIKGSLIYAPIEHRMLRGLSFEGSSFNKETFFVWYFVMPLALPTQYLYFSFGDRLRDHRGTDGWSVNQTDVIKELRDEVRNQALPWLAMFDSPVGAITLTKRLASESTNFRTWETAAGMLLTYGDIEGAIILIDRCLEVCDFSIPWHRDIAKYLDELKNACMESPQALETLLNSRTEQNLINLKLKT